MWSGQVRSGQVRLQLLAHKGGEVFYSDQVHREGQVNDRKESDNDRQNSVENEYNELVSKLLIGQKMFIPQQKYKVTKIIRSR